MQSLNDHTTHSFIHTIQGYLRDGSREPSFKNQRTRALLTEVSLIIFGKGCPMKKGELLSHYLNINFAGLRAVEFYQVDILSTAANNFPVLYREDTMITADHTADMTY